MKFDCGETHKEKNARLNVWHRWFAWYPVIISDHDCRWLEWVMRRGELLHQWDDSWWSWSYRNYDDGQS